MEKFLRQTEISPESTWSLLQWLRNHGANEFTIYIVTFVGAPTPRFNELQARLAPYSLGLLTREHLVAFPSEEIVRPTQVWRLNDDTEAILKEIFKAGLFESPAHEIEEGWVEQPTFYRNGELVLGIVSFEHEGMLRLDDDEMAIVGRELDLALHDSGECF